MEIKQRIKELEEDLKKINDAHVAKSIKLELLKKGVLEDGRLIIKSTGRFIPTIEEMLYGVYRKKDFSSEEKQMLRDFAASHVINALEHAAEVANMQYDGNPNKLECTTSFYVAGRTFRVNKDSILNAYPLEFIV